MKIYHKEISCQKYRKFSINLSLWYMWTWYNSLIKNNVRSLAVISSIIKAVIFLFYFIFLPCLIKGKEKLLFRKYRYEHLGIWVASKDYFGKICIYSRLKSKWTNYFDKPLSFSRFIAQDENINTLNKWFFLFYQFKTFKYSFLNSS